MNDTWISLIPWVIAAIIVSGAAPCALKNLPVAVACAVAGAFVGIVTIVVASKKVQAANKKCEDRDRDTAKREKHELAKWELATRFKEADSKRDLARLELTLRALNCALEAAASSVSAKIAVITLSNYARYSETAQSQTSTMRIMTTITGKEVEALKAEIDLEVQPITKAIQNVSVSDHER